MSSGYILTIALLNKSKNPSILENINDLGICINDSQPKVDSTLFIDRNRGVVFNNHNYSDPNNTTENKQLKKKFSKYVIEVLNISEIQFEILSRHYSQNLIGILRNTMNNILVQTKLEQDALIVTNAEGLTNIFIKDNIFYIEVKLSSIIIGVPFHPNNQYRYPIPGEVSALYKLTSEGFALQYIKTSNWLLRSFYIGPYPDPIDINDTAIEHAKFEEL